MSIVKEMIGRVEVLAIAKAIHEAHLAAFSLQAPAAAVLVARVCGSRVKLDVRREDEPLLAHEAVLYVTRGLCRTQYDSFSGAEAYAASRDIVQACRTALGNLRDYCAAVRVGDPAAIELRHGPPERFAVKVAAKRLRLHLKTVCRRDLSHSKCIEAIAVCLGYQN